MTGTLICTLRGHNNRIKSCLWMNYDSRMMTVGAEGVVYFWFATCIHNTTRPLVNTLCIHTGSSFRTIVCIDGAISLPVGINNIHSHTTSKVLNTSCVTLRKRSHLQWGRICWRIESFCGDEVGVQNPYFLRISTIDVSSHTLIHDMEFLYTHVCIVIAC